jgi:hypothetical protein
MGASTNNANFNGRKAEQWAAVTDHEELDSRRT